MALVRLITGDGSRHMDGPAQPEANEAPDPRIGLSSWWPGLTPDNCPPSARPELQWKRTFPGEERQLGALRRWLASLLPECPARDDATYVASELGANAIRHTASGRDGWFAVQVAWHKSVIRISVADQGGPTEPRVIAAPGAEHGRGLLLVEGLSIGMGTCGVHRGSLIWADVPWNGPSTRTPAEVSLR